MPISDKAKKILSEKEFVETQRARGLAQGASFYAADELEALYKSVAPEALGGEEGSYKEIRDKIRSAYKRYQEAYPVESLSAELAGSVPLAWLPFIGQANYIDKSLKLKTAIEMAKRGLAEGIVSGYGSSEQESLSEQLGDVGTSGVIGAVSSPIIGKIGEKISTGFGAALDFLRKKIGSRPSDKAVSELQRYAEGTGKSYSEIFDDIESGRILAEDPSLVGVVRAIKSKGSEKAGSSGARIIESLSERVGRKADEASRIVEGVLSPGTSARNVYKEVRQQGELLDKISGRAYKSIFEKNKNLDPKISSELNEILKRFPDVRDELQSYYQKSGKNFVPLFITKPNGEVDLFRVPSLEDAEIAYRLLRDQASALYDNSKGTLAGTYRESATNLKTLLDDKYEDLKNVRSLVAGRKSAKDAFDFGKKAFGMSADEVEFEYEMLLKNNPASAKAFKQGVLSAFRNKMKRSKNVAGRSADPDVQEGAILKIVAGDEYESVMETALRNAGLSKQAYDKIVHGSQTAPELAARASIGSGRMSMAEMASIAQGNPIALLNMVSAKLAKSVEADSSLSPQDYKKITDVLLSEDPKFVLNVLNDDISLGNIKKKLAPYASGIVRGAEQATRLQAQTKGTEEVRAYYNGGLFGLIP